MNKLLLALLFFFLTAGCSMFQSASSRDEKTDVALSQQAQQVTPAELEQDTQPQAALPLEPPHSQ